MTSVAVITGASKGIGLATAQELAKQGYSLGLVSRSESVLTALAANLSEQYPDQTFAVFPADLNRPVKTCKPLIDQVLDRLDRIDVLVNNAGVAGRIALLSEIEDEDIHATLHINLLAPILLTKHVLPHMVQRGGGTIINISSIAGKTAFPYWSVYCASKFGLSALSESVGEEQRGNGVKVLTIHPGAVDTPIWDAIDTAADRAPMLSADTVAQAITYALAQPEGAWVSDITLKPLRSVM